MPFKTCFFPFLVPFQLRSRTYEELHFHLFEFTHTHDELAGDDFVTESFPYLGYTERYFHSSRLLNVKEVDEDTLSGFWAEVYLLGTVGHRSHLGCEHKIELAHVGPVFGARDRTYDIMFFD